MTRIELVITGRVQNVAYRASAQEEALRLGLTGAVWNRDDGGVEAFAEGPEDRLEAFIAWCRRGPPAARVEEVRVTRAPARNETTTFRVTH